MELKNEKNLSEELLEDVQELRTNTTSDSQPEGQTDSQGNGQNAGSAKEAHNYPTNQP